MNKSIVRKIKLNELKSDFEYWQQQPITSRLATLQKIREEFISWKYGDRQEFQRVYKVIKQKRG
jgi:hypothetical protein